jgi:hypothetical protein
VAISFKAAMNATTATTSSSRAPAADGSWTVYIGGTFSMTYDANGNMIAGPNAS